jgi:hypothetical protein
MRCKTMADGSLRIEVEVEPKDAQAAFALFGRPGAPMALAALKEGFASAAEAELKTPAEQRPKGGPLSILAGRWCGSPAFHAWLRATHPVVWEAASESVQNLNHTREHTNSDIAAEAVRYLCDVESRAQLDHRPESADLFHRLIRLPFSEDLERTGQTV